MVITMAMAKNPSMGGGNAKKIAVSQATIDKIKKMGMTKALAGAKSANPEMKEALTRMYGARRVSAASAKSSASSVGTPFGQAQSKPSAKRTRVGTPAGTSKTTKPAAKKKTGTTDPFAKFVFGVGRAAKEPFTSKNK